MSKLSDIKASLKDLEMLGLPISNEQKQSLAEAESEYIDELIPKIKELLAGLFKDIDIKTRIAIEYDGNPSDELNVYLVDTEKSMQQMPQKPQKKETKRSIPNRKTPITGFRLKVTYPDGRQLIGKGTEVLKQLVNEIGPKTVYGTGVIARGILLVDDHLDTNLSQYQRPVNDGYFLMTNTSNTQKKKEIEQISNRLDLGLKVSVIDENDKIVG